MKLGSPIYLTILLLCALIFGALGQDGFPGRDIVLKADTEKYLSRWKSYDIEIAKHTPDRYCHFEVIHNSDGTYSFRGDNGLYLSRYGSYNIEARKECIDIFSKFHVEFLTNNRILLKADNGLYWSRWGDTGLVARKEAWDQYCIFTVETTSDDYKYC